MRKIIKKTKEFFNGRKIRVAAASIMLLFISAGLYPVQMDENLVDDVVAMITNAKKIAHTIFLLDTSESMNTFAFSDYINTCKDSKANIDKAIFLCNNAYNQCRNVEANAMCGVNLGCGDILGNCQKLQVTRTRLYSFCADVENIYKAPLETQVIADPTGGGSNDAKKYVGPWDPRRADYKLDLCFYNWTEDTGGQVLNDQTSGHWTNPNNGSGYTDRRDWDCLTNGILQPEFRGGLWLNWKYSTSLDAIKIILGDVHDFSYPPRQRGERKCQLTQYFPYKNDALLGRICYQEFETNPGGPSGPLELEKIAGRVRAGWTKFKDGIIHPDASCTGALFTVNKDTVLPGDPDSKNSSWAPCDVCLDYDGNEIPCRQYAVAASGNITTSVNGITAEVDYTCCVNYECSNPKCRDDDISCRSDAPACVLGYYSDFDQDQNHCCAMLSCIENDPSGCAGGGRYLPGPGNDVYSDPTANTVSLGMPPIAPPNQFQNVTLTAKVVSLNLGANPANVDKVIVTVYYGCDSAGEVPATKAGEEKTFTAAVVPPGTNIFSAPVDLEGCPSNGYSVNTVAQLFHKGVAFSKANISLDVEFIVSYTSGADADIKVLDHTQVYYSEFISEATGAPSDRVNEYECKTTFYSKQSTVVNGGSGNCPPKHPNATVCTEPDHSAIAKDQWGKTTKTACSWLCRNEIVYDDVWKCRAFFTQMDNPLRGGPGACMGFCPGDNPATLEACCTCINANAWRYKNLETPDRVKFSPAGALLNCSVSGYEEGITSDGKRTFTSAYMAEVITGSIKELGDSSYRLNPAGYVSPYNLGTNQWYSSLSLLNRSGSFLKDSFISVFETGKNDTRDIACVYDLMDNFEGQDCDDCGTGCCSITIGGGTDYCDYPNFWMKIPNTEGGRLILPATNVSGAGVTTFQNLIKSLKAKGGSTLGETLYDVWRYLGGMKPAHDLNPLYATGFPSPYQATDPLCFINDAIVISGGQPQFDDNYSIRAKTTQALPAPIPYVVPNALDVATLARPYVRENWYLTSFLNVANFVTTKDFFHANTNCRIDNNVNIYGYEIGGTAATGDLCTKATDYFDYPLNNLPTGNNFIDTIHTVAIGEWTLAPLFNNPNVPEYLDHSVLRTAAVNSGGKYFSLTAQGADGNETFYDLTSMFNAFAASGSPLNRAAGRPHWSSPLVQAYDKDMMVRGPYSYSPAIIPIDNRTSRFWFGNLKQYTIDDASSGCNLTIDVSCAEWDKLSIPSADCFYPTDHGADMPIGDFATIMGGGAARKLAERVAGTAAPCDNVVGSLSACFASGARNILYDDGSDLLELKTANTLWFASQFQLKAPAITHGQAISILDYIYGYDAFDEYPPLGTKNHMRFSNTPFITIDNPFSMSFDGSSTTRIRPLIMGGIHHSKPVAVHYEDTDTTRIFVGANDGMFHSFDQNGNETFAYIPKPVLPALTGILNSADGIFFNSFVDGPITLLHIDQSRDGIINEGEKAYLIFGYGRGAKGHTVIDISELDKPKFVQHILTEGYSFGGVAVFRKCDKAECRLADELTYYLAVPGGYDPCHDPDVPICPLNGSGHLDPMGNEIYFYKLNKTNENFDFVKKYDMYTPSNNPLVRDPGWMRTSFASTPVPINTRGSLGADTEFVYFYDVSSTVFRVDMEGKNDPATWEFKAVLAQRLAPQPISWGSGVRVYNSFNVFPPFEQYPAYGLGDNIIPVPISTGNRANTRASEIDEMIMMYDKWDSDYFYPILNANITKDVSVDDTGNGNQPWPGVDTWKYPFLKGKISEKSITSPLVFHTKKDGSGSYVSWNTYQPQNFDECRNWGDSFNYEKQLVDGMSGIDRWSSVYCGAGSDPISLATEVGVVKRADDYALTFGAGADIYMKGIDRPQAGPAEIIKWYELY